MIERRKQSRVRVELRVEISGINAVCEKFAQSAMATNLSKSGALLKGVATVLRCGDLLTLKYGEKQAEFRIVWVLDRGTNEGFEVAVYRLPESPCPWEAVLDLQEKSSRSQSETGDQEEALVRK